VVLRYALVSVDAGVDDAQDGTLLRLFSWRTFEEKINVPEDLCKVFEFYLVWFRYPYGLQTLGTRHIWFSWNHCG